MLHVKIIEKRMRNVADVKASAVSCSTAGTDHISLQRKVGQVTEDINMTFNPKIPDKPKVL